MTQGDSRKALDKNMAEALNAYLDEPADSRAIFPLPCRGTSEKNIAAVAVDPQVANLKSVFPRLRLDDLFA